MGKGGEMGMEIDFASGHGCTVQCADDLLFCYTLETCVVL